MVYQRPAGVKSIAISAALGGPGQLPTPWVTHLLVFSTSAGGFILSFEPKPVHFSFHFFTPCMERFVSSYRKSDVPEGRRPQIRQGCFMTYRMWSRSRRRRGSGSPRALLMRRTDIGPLSNRLGSCNGFPPSHP
jgi:hypothetical protein